MIQSLTREVAGEARASSSDDQPATAGGSSGGGGGVALAGARVGAGAAAREAAGAGAREAAGAGALVCAAVPAAIARVAGAASITARSRKVFIRLRSTRYSDTRSNQTLQSVAGIRAARAQFRGCR